MPFHTRGFAKKGVSPLIATVLLISFAVALGSVVLNWGRNLDVSPSDDICEEVKILIRDLGNTDVCYKSDGKQAFLNFALTNDGSVPVEGLGIFILGEKGTKLLDLDTFTIAPKGLIDVIDTSVAYDIETYGNIKQVQFLPKAKGKDSITLCPGSTIKTEKVRAC